MTLSTGEPLKVGIAGAAGVWANACHCPAINELVDSGFPLHVVATPELTDPISSVKARGHSAAQRMLELHRPIFIDAGHGIDAALSHLGVLHSHEPLDLLIVSTDPVAHLSYCSWAAHNAVPFLCDKPITAAANCSSSLSAAAAIQESFENLLRIGRVARQRNPRFQAATILRRRNLPPFLLAASSIEKVYKSFEAPLTSMALGVSVGVHFTPSEYLSLGAHGFLDGCGAFSFSSYHYLDVIAWFLSLATGSTTHLRIECPYVFRVEDCLKAATSEPLFRLLKAPIDRETEFLLPEAVAAAELDFFLTMTLLDGQGRPLGLLSYAYHRTSHTTRTILPDAAISNPGAHERGGRMSQVLIDLHQGPLQSIRLSKNDSAFGKQKLKYERRIHPILGTNTFEELVFDDAYENGATPKHLVQNFIQTLVEPSLAGRLSLPSPLDSQELTHRIFAASYEVLAEEAGSRKLASAKTSRRRPFRIVPLK